MFPGFLNRKLENNKQHSSVKRQKANKPVAPRLQFCVIRMTSELLAREVTEFGQSAVSIRASACLEQQLNGLNHSYNWAGSNSLI